MPGFATFRDGVKRPSQLAGADIKCAYRPARPRGRIFRNSSSSNHQVFEDRGSRGHSVLRVWEFIRNSRTEIHDASRTEALTRLATLRIQADQASIEGSVEDAPIISCFALPVRNAAVLEIFSTAAARLWIELPNFSPCFGIQCDHSV